MEKTSVLVYPKILVQECIIWRMMGRGNLNFKLTLHDLKMSLTLNSQESLATYRVQMSSWSLGITWDQSFSTWGNVASEIRGFRLFCLEEWTCVVFAKRKNSHPWWDSKGWVERSWDILHWLYLKLFKFQYFWKLENKLATLWFVTHNYYSGITTINANRWNNCFILVAL